MSDHTRNMTCQQRSTVSIMISSCSDCSSASVWFGVVLETGVDPVVPDWSYAADGVPDKLGSLHTIFVAQMRDWKAPVVQGIWKGTY